MLFFLFCALLAIEPSMAQDNEVMHTKFEGGLVFGSCISQVDGDTYSGYHKIGLNTGGLVYINFTQSIGISMELLYVNKGSRGGVVNESPAVGTYIDKYYLNLNYVEVPLLFHLRIMEYYDFEGGVSYARLIKSHEWAEADVPIYIDPTLAYFNSQDINYVLGASVRLSKHWVGNARFQYSIVPIRPWDRVLPRYGQYGVNQYNNTVSLRMIYML
jgi:hypothetical protein